MARDIDAARHDAAVQALVEQAVGTLRQIFPVGERALGAPPARGLLGVVDVVAAGAGRGLAVASEQFLEFVEQIGFGAEVADAALAVRLGALDQPFHLLARVAVETVALDDRRVDILAVEDRFEGVLDGGRAGAGRTGHRDDRVLHRHGSRSRCEIGPPGASGSARCPGRMPRRKVTGWAQRWARSQRCHSTNRLGVAAATTPRLTAGPADSEPPSSAAACPPASSRISWPAA